MDSDQIKKIGDRIRRQREREKRIKEQREREERIRAFRRQYRKDLQQAREKHGDWIPFGYNLGLLNAR